MFRICITCHSMYNILFQHTCEIYWCSETVSHVTPCTIYYFNIQVRYTDVQKLYHMSLHVQYSVSISMWHILIFWNSITYHSMYNILFECTCEIYWCSEPVSHVTPCRIFCFNIHVRYTDVLKLYHMFLHVQYTISIYKWDILMFRNCMKCHSMYNILFQYPCDIYWYSETLSHVTPCKISNCDVSRPHTTTLSIRMLCYSHVPI